MKCEAGVENYCPTVQTHPGEVIAFGVIGLVGGAALESFILGGGGAVAAETAFWKAAQSCIGSVVCRWVTGMAGGAGVTTNNPLQNIKYTEKVLTQATQGDYHGFPEVVDAFGSDGTVTTIVGGDGVSRTLVQIEGIYKGIEGVFEYIIEIDGYCNHRLFVPKDFGGGC